MTGRSAHSHEDMARVMALIAECLGNLFSGGQQIVLAAQAMEETANDMRQARAIRDQNRVLRRQINRLETKIMKGKSSVGKGGEGAGQGPRRLRRRRNYTTDTPIAAKNRSDNPPSKPRA